MEDPMAKTVVGLFDTFTHAESAVQALMSAGFRREEISIAANDARGEYGKSLTTKTTTDGKDAASGALTGAGVGAAVGGLGGLILGLVGVGALAIPGIGPIIAAGPLAAALSGAAVGAAAGGLIGGLTKLGVPEEHAHHYAEGVRRGGTLVTVKAEDAEAQRAADILNGKGAIDIDQRAAFWKKQGWQKFDHKAPAYTHEQIAKEREMLTKIPVVQEEVKVGKREVAGGGVRVYQHVTEQPVRENVQLREEQVKVERHAVNRPATAQDMRGMKDGSFEVTARSEEAVVAKQARVVEEVEVRKDVAQRTEQIRETAKRTDVQVEQIAGNRSYDRFENDWKQNFQTNYASTGAQFDAYMPAYRYGADMCMDQRYRNKDWNAVEPELRRNWETTNRGTAWDKVKGAVQHAFGRAKSAVSGRRDDRVSQV
jgi:uncharacterized protein (TIGR02271 family)